MGQALGLLKQCGVYVTYWRINDLRSGIEGFRVRGELIEVRSGGSVEGREVCRGTSYPEKSLLQGVRLCFLRLTMAFLPLTMVG